MTIFRVPGSDRMRDRVSMTRCRIPELDMRSTTNITSYRISESK
jgi:hypothetical protein